MMTGVRGVCRRLPLKPKGVAKVATARKLAVRLYWMLRQNVGYPEIAHIESSSRVPLAGSKQAEGLIERFSHPAVGWMFAWKHHGL